MIEQSDRLDSLTQYTADELLRQSRVLIDQFGIEEGQQLARKALTTLAEMALSGDQLMLPTEAYMTTPGRAAVARGAISVAMTMTADGTALN